ncbi:4583_t:CDS:2 [Funneliformis mosseae]|uniref:4583_t:CDS:1 n=1 Tax=Funneliformis mosseae TaxID=27381 RepID=A0A9N9CYN7_FUNMO|nr:4583_t:CDS:2 [Funneliformis mosseae]
MNSTIELVLKHCPTQLELYQRCIENNPTEWSIKCQKEKYELTKCSEDNIPTLRQVKKQCNEMIQAFDKCLAKNETEPEKCTDFLRNLYDCIENATDNKKAKFEVDTKKSNI